MPTSLRMGPYRFFFYSGDKNEPPHTHIQRDAAEAKFWISPIRLNWNRGFPGSELRQIQKIIAENENQLKDSWDEYFNS